MQQYLQIFEDESRQRIRTLNIGGSVWFVASDVCSALGISNVSQAVSGLDDDEKLVYVLHISGQDREVLTISESGLYGLILRSRKPEAKRFRKWITSEAIPQIRKTGNYSLTGQGVPNFVRRFNDNWDRVPPGHFSVISELFIRLYGRLEHAGYRIPDIGQHGRQIRPDVSVGLLFSKWLKANHPEHAERRTTYSHLFPDGSSFDAYAYHVETLPLFVNFVDSEWIPNNASKYFTGKDSKALPFLSKIMLPPVATRDGFHPPPLRRHRI